MNLFLINADVWKMDGGVAFGVVPKLLWSKLYPADENNLMPIHSKCLLIDTGERRILFNTGMGNKRDDKYYQVRHRFSDNLLIENLEKAGFKPADITDVIFTHLHDDHCGGAVIQNNYNDYELLFPNAQYWCSLSQYEWFANPNVREAASYFRDNIEPIIMSGKLTLIEEPQEFAKGIDLRFFNGHTRGQIIPFIHENNSCFVYVSDFIPSSAHLPIAYIPSVDIDPLLSMKEKESFLQEAVLNNYILMFEHDAFTSFCRVNSDGKKYTANFTSIDDDGLFVKTIC